MSDTYIRKEIKADYKKIKNINNLAFNQLHEGQLIESLRKRKEFVPELSLVAIHKRKVVGHILYFPIKIITEKDSVATLSLAPMAVLPEYQGKGIGGYLIKAGLQKASGLGYNSVVVLGHPEYYPRFGFLKASNWKIKEPFGVPDDVMMAIELKEGSLDFGGGMLDYPEEFFDVI